MALGKGYRDLAAARQKASKVGRQTELGYKAFDIAGEALGFIKSQTDRVKTAWEEYEEGAKSLGLEAFDPKKPKKFKKLFQTLVPFGNKGYFEMPEGKVLVEGKEYDMEKIRELGSFHKKLGQFLPGEKEDILIKYRNIIGLPVATPGKVRDTKKGASLPSKRTEVWDQFLEDLRTGKTSLSWEQYKKGL